MKKTAVMIYEGFCYFEISVALEILALNHKEIVVCAKSLEPVVSECGMTILPQKTFSSLDINQFDSLLLPGMVNAMSALKDEELLLLIRQFNEHSLIIGAISIAPILLLKAGILKDKVFLAGVNPIELIEIGFHESELRLMVGWDQHIANPIEAGYVIADNIITSVSFNFVRWGLAFCDMLGISMNGESFGL